MNRRAAFGCGAFFMTDDVFMVTMAGETGSHFTGAALAALMTA